MKGLNMAARIWMGCDKDAWRHLLAQSAVARSGLRPDLVRAIGAWAGVNSAARRVQELLHGRQLDAALARALPSTEAPLVIVGHWRTGTTHLQQLLSLHRDLDAPDTWECFAPHAAMLLTERSARWIAPRVPSRRPMDAMSMTLASPQEDELALLLSGLPSPYLRLAFPRAFAKSADWLPFFDWTPAQEGRADLTLRRFLALVALRRQRGLPRAAPGGARRFDPRRSRLVLKSPPHTYRLRWLRRCFGQARLVYLHREPLAMLRSTQGLWRDLGAALSVERAPVEALPLEQIAAELQHLHRRFCAQLGLTPEARLADAPVDAHLAYRDIDSTCAAPQQIFQRLLGLARALDLDPEGFDRDLVMTHLERLAQGYRTNPLPPLEPEVEARLRPLCDEYARFHGYVD